MSQQAKARDSAAQRLNLQKVHSNAGIVEAEEATIPND
jgi:hypothetical protein